jgi:hypothetical protein
MADLKISQLTSATLPLAGTEVLPIVQSSSTKKVATDDLTVKNVRSNATTGILQVAGPAAGTTRTMTVPNANFTAARTDAAQSFTGDQTLGTGNLIQGTAAKGVNFTANTPAAGMTSQLLNWYEEGTFTPTIGASTTPGTQTYLVQVGRYTRIGNRVFYNLRLVMSAKDVATAGNIFVTGLPFVSNSTGSNFSAAAISSVGNLDLSAGYTQICADMQPNDTKIYLGQAGDNAAYALLTASSLNNDTRIVLSGHYEV